MNRKNIIMTNGTITTIKDFAETVRQSIEAYYEEGYKIEVHSVIKNNDCRMIGLVIRDGKCNIAPTIYLDGFYEKYQRGMTLETICREIIFLYEENKIGSNFDITFFTDFSNVRNRICYKLVNAERNKEMLSDMPHIRILDLALVFYVLLNRDKDGTQTIAVKNNMLEIWKVSTETLYEEAILNTPRLFPCDIKPMRDIIREMMELEMDKESVDEYFDMMLEEDVPVEMYVITNVFRISGAVAIFYKDVLRNLANQLDCDLYILPSSIHETILLPVTKNHADVEELREMVQEVNRTQVIDQELLSDNVYIYNRYKDRVELL